MSFWFKEKGANFERNFNHVYIKVKGGTTFKEVFWIKMKKYSESSYKEIARYGYSDTTQSVEMYDRSITSFADSNKNILSSDIINAVRNGTATIGYGFFRLNFILNSNNGIDLFEKEDVLAYYIEYSAMVAVTSDNSYLIDQHGVLTGYTIDGLPLYETRLRGSEGSNEQVEIPTVGLCELEILATADGETKFNFIAPEDGQYQLSSPSENACFGKETDEGSEFFDINIYQFELKAGETIRLFCATMDFTDDHYIIKLEKL